MTWLHYEEVDDFYAAVGFGGVSLNQISGRIVTHLHREEQDQPQLPLTPVEPKQPTYGSSIKVQGTNDVLCQIARCCNPVPGDEIVGYVTRARGVSVHRVDCHNVTNSNEQERFVEVEWGTRGQLFPVAIRVEAWDRVGLLRDLSTIAAEEKVNMTGVRTQEHNDHTTSVSITLETTGVEQLSRLLGKMEGVQSVLSVARETHSRE
jgi:GTP pyrophosphokinase